MVTAEEVKNDVEQLQQELENLKAFSASKLPNLEFPRYNGSNDEQTLGEFLDRFYELGTIYGWTKKRMCQVIVGLLSGEAFVVYKSLPKEIREDWEALVNAFYQRFGRAADHRYHQRVLERRVQGKDETVTAFSAAIKKLTERAFPPTYEIPNGNGGTSRPYTKQFMEREQVERFLRGLRPNIKEPLRRKTEDSLPDSLQKALELALREERFQKELLEDRLDRTDDMISAVAVQGQLKGLRQEMQNAVAAVTRVFQAPFQRSHNNNRGRFQSPNRGRFQSPPPRPWNPSRGNSGSNNRGFPSFQQRNNQGYFNPQRSNRQPRRRIHFRDVRDHPHRERSQDHSSERRQDNREDRDAPRGQFRRHAVNAMMPLMSLLMCLFVANASGHRQLQICSVTRGAFFLAPPHKQSCEPPIQDEAHHVIVELFVPKTTPTLIEAYHCTNITTTTCSKSAMWFVAKMFSRPTLQQPVESSLCWKMVRTTKVTDNITLSQEDIDLWRTDEQAVVPRRFWGEECRSTSNYVVQKGSLGTLDGELISSDLSSHLNCSIFALACNDTKGTTVWEQPSEFDLCRYEAAGRFPAIISNTHVLVDEIQAAFVVSKDQRINRTADLQCLPPHLVRMENEVYATVQQPTEWRHGRPDVGSTRSPRRPRAIDPWLDCDAPEPIFVPKPLPPFNWQRPSDENYSGAPTFRRLQRGPNVWYRNVHTGIIEESLTRGSILLHPNGTKEVLQRDVPPQLDGGYYTIDDQRLDWANQPRPLFPGRCCSSHKSGWPYLGKQRSVLHRQFNESYPQGEITYDYFTGYGNSFDIDHPCDLAHGTVIDYPGNSSQLHMFWKSKREFQMLRPEAFRQRERERLETPYSVVLYGKRRLRRTVETQPLENSDAERERVRQNLLNYCKRVNYDDSACAEVAPSSTSSTTTTERAKTTRRTKPTTTSATTTRQTTARTTTGRTTATQKRTSSTTRLTSTSVLPTSPPSTPVPEEEIEDTWSSEDDQDEPPPATSDLAVHAWKGHRDQHTNDENTRMQWLEDRMMNETKAAYVRLWKQVCRLHNNLVDHVLTALRFDATAGVRLFLHRDDVHASFVGEALAVSACTQVFPTEIHWNHKWNNTCYMDVPVRVNGSIWFIQPGTRELVKESRKVHCDQRPVSIYKDTSGTWRTDAGNVAQVASLTHRLQFRGQVQPIELTAPTIFNSDLATVATSVSAIGRYAERINSVERVVRSLAAEPELPIVGQVIDEVVQAANDTAQKVVSTTSGWFKDVRDLFTEWYHFAYLAIVILAILVAGSLCVYTAPLWMPCFKAAETNRGQSFELRPYQRRPLISAVEPTAPKKDLEIVEYYPECCHVAASCSSSQQLRVRIAVNYQPVDALFDTGSSITFCRQQTAQSLGAVMRSTPLHSARAANGTQIPFLGEFDAVIDYGTMRKSYTVLVSTDQGCPAPMIIGTDFMKHVSSKSRVTLDFAKKTISVGTQELAMLSSAVILPTPEARICVCEDTELEPRSDNLVPCYLSPDVENTPLKRPPSSRPQEVLLTSANHEYPEIIVGDVVAQVDDTLAVPLRVLNTGNRKVKLFKGSTLAYAEPPASVSAVVYDPSVAIVKTECSPTATYTPPEANWTDKLPRQMPPLEEQVTSKLDLSESILSAAAKRDLKQIIVNHSDAFVGEDGNIGKYNGPIHHRIDVVPDATPFQLRPYRTPLALRAEVQRQIEDMLRQGIIRPSTSPFCSPIVMVKKADGKSWRFAVDYRKLNSITVKQTYYLPLIQDILDLVGGKRYYSNFDFQSGFHQIPVHPPHVERTAFATFLGLFEFLRMPFGLCSAPSTFQRVMETMRKELTAAFFIYLDDVVLASDSECQHLADIDQFLNVIENYQMRLRLDKCTFGRAEIKYLGFLISEQGMRPDPKNVAAVNSIKIPKTLTELRSFIGAVSYFRRFIPNFAGLMKPLYDLTKKETLSEWTQTHHDAFEMVKQKLSEAPVLAPPRFGRPFVVETDASATAIAACLLQEDKNGEIHPVAYASRLLNKHEARYPSVESETLAIVFALRTFAPYLEGAGTSLVRTDNSALSALLQKKDLAGRLAKYQMTIQPFDVHIVHRSGKSNKFCDFLSRYPGHEVSAAVIPVTTLTLDEIRTEQRRVLDYQLLYDAIKSDRWPLDPLHRKRLQELTRAYSVHKGLLHFVNPDDTDDVRRILVPYTLRTRLIKQFHSTPLDGAHLGTEKILHKLKARFYWPGMAEDVAQVVTSCDTCQKRKTAPSTVSREPLHMIPVPTFPFDRVHADIMGPLAETPRKNKYAFVVICAFTKWLIAVPLPDQTATTVSTAFINHVVAQHGVPTRVITDQGRQFMGTIFTQLAEHLRFEHASTTPYHQQANGMIERQNQTLASMIAAYVRKQGDDWDEYLPLVTFAYNTSVQSSTQMSPFWLLYCRDARIPLDLTLERGPTHTNDSVSLYIRDVEQALQAAWTAARTTMQASQDDQKRAADQIRRTREHDFHEKDLILIYRDQPTGADKHKFRLRWEGPYRVMRVQRPNLVVRLLRDDAPLKEVHMDKCKPYKEDHALPLHTMDFEPARPNHAFQAAPPPTPPAPLIPLQEPPVAQPGPPQYVDPRIEMEAPDDEEDLYPNDRAVAAPPADAWQRRVRPSRRAADQARDRIRRMADDDTDNDY